MYRNYPIKIYYLDTAIRTLGPISLSEVILHSTSAADLRTSSSFSQQKIYKRHIIPSKRKIHISKSIKVHINYLFVLILFEIEFWNSL